MYADICTKELVCACVLHMVVYVGVGNICVCAYYISQECLVFLCTCDPPWPALS